MSTHLRIAAAVCGLSTGLLVAAAPIASAAPDADSGTTHESSTTGTAKPPTSSRGPIGSAVDTLHDFAKNSARDTVQGISSTLNTLASGQPRPSTSTSPKTTFGGTPTVRGTSGTVRATPAPSVPEATNAAPAATPKIPNVATFASDVAAPVDKALTAATQTVAAVPALVASLPTSATPVSDVIGTVQSLLTSVVDAGNAVTQLPNDLATLLGVPSVPATTPGTPGQASARAADAPSAAPLPNAPQFAVPTVVENVRPAVELAGPVLPLPAFTATTSPTASNAPVSTPSPAPQGQEPGGLSTVERVITAFVASVSLVALAAMALPGILGLLGACAAGVRIGHRQAKAGSELPSTVISRFVGSGPVGVVRSTSQITLRSRSRARTRSASTPVTSPVATVHLLERAG